MPRGGQKAVEILPDAAARIAKVVPAAETSQRAEPGQVVEVDQPQVHAVAENVAERGHLGMGDPALIDLRGHQVPPSARAAAAPDRQPSS